MTYAGYPGPLRHMAESSRTCFGDRRKSRPGFTPKQVLIHRNRKNCRLRRKKMKVEQDLADLGQEIANAKKTKRRIETAIERRARILREISNAPSPAKQRSVLFQMLEDANYNPVEELIRLAKAKDTDPKDRLKITMMLAELTFPKPKSVDIQGHISGSVSVAMVDFTQAGEATDTEAIEVEAYAEFQSPEDKRAALP